MDIFDIKLEKQMHYNHRQKYFKGKEQQNYFKQAWQYENYILYLRILNTITVNLEFK